MNKILLNKSLKSIANNALQFIKDDDIIGLGSGYAATVFVRKLSTFLEKKNIVINGVTTSLQIKLIAENTNIQLIESDVLDSIDIMFDGADQIDKKKNLIKGGGGALLRENIINNMSKKVIIIADESKFVDNLCTNIPIEIHPISRNFVIKSLIKLGGNPKIRIWKKGYPIITENGNIIIDCSFGKIKEPKKLANKLINIPGVFENGIFTRKPDVIYKAYFNGDFDIL